jgi:guanylate kinase
VLTKEEFDAAVASGQLLEHHPDLFTHPLAVHRHGHSLEDLQAIIKAGKLPLLELEAEQAELLKVTKSVDCLSIFLAPPSLEEHQQRLQQAVTETDEEVADRGAVAAAELATVKSQDVFDQVLVNDELEEGYQQLKGAISKFRPDLIPPAADESAAKAAQQAAANTPVPLLVAGPAGISTCRQQAAVIVLGRPFDCCFM